MEKSDIYQLIDLAEEIIVLNKICALAMKKESSIMPEGKDASISTFNASAEFADTVLVVLEQLVSE